VSLGASLATAPTVAASQCTIAADAQATPGYTTVYAHGQMSNCPSYGRIDLTVTVQRCSSWAFWGCVTRDNKASYFDYTTYDNYYNGPWHQYGGTTNNHWRVGVDGYFNNGYVGTTYSGTVNN
jgi:hypothetical protein